MDFNKNDFAKRIKEIRLAKGLTQEELSEKISIESSNYSNFETAKTMPSLPNLYKIINGLEINPNELFEVKHLDNEAKLDEINLKIYNNFSLSQKKALYKILRALEDFK